MELETFQKELTIIGGLNQYGEPNLRVVRGDQEMKFACGRMIPKYSILGAARVSIDKFFRKRHIFLNKMVVECARDEAREIYERSRRADLTNHWMPETYDKVTVTPTAQDGYFIEQYYTPEMIKDTPEMWERNRYKMWSPHPLVPEKMTDMVGPFPSRGRYDCFAQGEELTAKLLKNVRRAWVRRNEWKQTKSAQSMVNDVYEEADRRDGENERLVKEMLDSAIVPHSFSGVYLNKPSKFIHDGEAKTI